MPPIVQWEACLPSTSAQSARVSKYDGWCQICSPGLLQRSVQRSFWFFSRSSHSSTSCPQPLQAVWRRVRHTFGHAPPSRQPLLDPNHGDGGKPDYRLVPEPPLPLPRRTRWEGKWSGEVVWKTLVSPGRKFPSLKTLLSYHIAQSMLKGRT